jgi:hypothetical protein
MALTASRLLASAIVSGLQLLEFSASAAWLQRPTVSRSTTLKVGHIVLEVCQWSPALQPDAKQEHHPHIT